MNELERVQEIVRSFRRVNRTLYQLLREEADLLDTTVVQIMTLRVLKKQPNIGLGELAGRLQLGNSTVSGVVERLVSAGMIVRERSSEDRRSVTMRLTPKGEQKQEEAFGNDSLLSRKLLRILELPEEDLGHLLRTHDQIIEKLQQRGGEADHGEHSNETGRN